MSDLPFKTDSAKASDAFFVIIIKLYLFVTLSWQPWRELTLSHGPFCV